MSWRHFGQMGQRCFDGHVVDRFYGLRGRRFSTLAQSGENGEPPWLSIGRISSDAAQRNMRQMRSTFLLIVCRPNRK